PSLPGFVHATLAKRSYALYSPPPIKDQPLQTKSPLEKLSQTMRSLSLQSTNIESDQAGLEKKEVMVGMDGGAVAENVQIIQRRKEDHLTNNGKVEDTKDYSGKGTYLDRNTVGDNEVNDKEQNGTISTQPGDRSSAGSSIANSLQ